MKLISKHNRKTIITKVDEEILIELNENSTTGYKWNWEQLDVDKILPLEDYYIVSNTTADGASGLRHFRIKLIKEGNSTIKLTLRQPWEMTSEPSAEFLVVFQVEPS